jgi:hypothetical protein
MTEQAKDGPDHELMLRQFEEAFENSADERNDAELARDYYDGKQLTPDEITALQARKQPPVISNRIKPKIDALLGHEKRQRTDPKAYPRTPKHEEEANSVTDAIRFVCDQNRFPRIRSEAAESLFIEGVGAATVGVVRKPDGRMDVTLNCVPWDRFYRDPHSRKRDFSDANYLGVVLWMDEADAKSTYGGKAAVVEGCYEATEGEGDTYDDRPRFTWSDKKRKRIRVIQHRYREGGKWMQATVCKGGFLRDPQVSPYVDEDGVPECDLIAVSVYVDRENNRYGAVKMMISPQDEINKRRSKALHLLNTRLVIAEKGAVADVERARTEANKPDGYVEVIGDMRFEFVETQGLVAGQFQLLQEAKAEIDASGVNPAIEGDLKASSGRAQEMIAAAGLAEQAMAFDALKDWSWRVYRAVWHRIRQYWTEERWIRVTDDERNLRWVGVNRPKTQGDVLLEQAKQAGKELPPEAMAQLKADPAMQQIAMGPDGQPMLANPIGSLDVDLILEDGPDSVTIQAEQFEQLVELKKADPTAIPTAAVIEASQLRNKDKLLQHLEQGGIPPQIAEQMQAMQQELQQCQQALKQAEMNKGREKQEAQAIKAQVSADIKVAQADLARQQAEMALQQAQWELAQAARGQELEVARYEAHTDRIAALKPDPQPKDE